MDYATCPRLHVNSPIRSARTLCALFLHDATYDDMCDVWNESSRRAIDRRPPLMAPLHAIVSLTHCSLHATHPSLYRLAYGRVALFNTTGAAPSPYVPTMVPPPGCGLRTSHAYPFHSHTTLHEPHASPPHTLQQGVAVVSSLPSLSVARSPACSAYASAPPLPPHKGSKNRTPLPVAHAILRHPARPPAPRPHAAEWSVAQWCAASSSNCPSKA